MEPTISSARIIHYAPRRSVLAIEVEPTDGQRITGYGEAMLEGSADTLEQLLQRLIQLVSRVPVWDSTTMEEMWRASSFYPLGLLGMSALSALDQALWDVRGKLLDRPVWQLIGGGYRSNLPLYFHAPSGDSFPETTAEAQARAESAYTAVLSQRDRGVRLFKTAAFGPIDELVEGRHLELQVTYLRTLKDLLGPDTDLALDVHGRYSYASALRLLEALSDLNLAFVEEPLNPSERGRYGELQRRAAMPLAAGERLAELWEFQELLDHGIGILQPDLAHCGGITAGLRIGALARQAGASVALHNPLGPINLCASLQLVASQPNFTSQEVVDLGGSFLSQPLEVSKGSVPLESLRRPGLGSEIGAGQLSPSTSAAWRTPVWKYSNGAVRPW